MGAGGEIFVLDMGEPVLVLDLAKRMIEMSGHRREGEIDIVFTGMRPGEKLFESCSTARRRSTRPATPRSSSARSPRSRGPTWLKRSAGCASWGRTARPTRCGPYLATFLPEAQLTGPGVPAGRPSS